MLLPPRIGYHRFVASGCLAAGHAALAYAYLTPDLARGAGPRPGQISIMLYIDSLGPVWQLAFGVTALLLVGGLTVPRWLATAHTVSGAVVGGLGASLWAGFAFSEPRPAILSAIAYTLITVWHVTISVTYARLTSLGDKHEKRARGKQTERGPE